MNFSQGNDNLQVNGIFPAPSTADLPTIPQMSDRPDDNADGPKSPDPQPGPSPSGGAEAAGGHPTIPQPASSEQASSPPTRQSSPGKSPTTPVTPTNPSISPKSESVPLPSPADDISLDQEIEEALGDVSLIDMYDLDGLEIPTATPTPQPSAPAPGVRRGKVVAVTADGAFVELGGKSQGLLPPEEFAEGQPPQAGAMIDVSIVGRDDRDGLLILSTRTAEHQLMVSNLREGVLVEGRVTGTNKGGLELDIKGLKAFMPISQIDLDRVENLDPYIGQKFVCEVTQVERGDKNVVVSRRNVLARQRQEQGEKLWTELEKGQTRHGKVSNIADYGAFIDLGGVDGLLHVREMSWARVKHPRDILQVGQEIDVLITGIDREKKRIALSLRQAGGDPWTTAAQKYPVKSRHQAQIKNLMDFGAFAELEPGIDGLIPISEMTWAGRIRHPSDVVQPGGLVEVEILNCDVEKRRISMSMKSLQENPWLSTAQRYAPDQTLTGTVARITDFGAFITLEPGVDGLIHISELSDKHVNQVSDVLSEGQQVTVRVLSVDRKNHRIALSMKQTAPLAEQAPEPAQPLVPEPQPEKNKKQRPRRGGLSF